MSAPRFTPAAHSDLSAIWDVTEDRGDGAQADTYVHELYAAAERVTDTPERGVRVEHIRPGYRRYGIGSHLLFFTILEGEVTIVRILHQRMDPTRHL